MYLRDGEEPVPVVPALLHPGDPLGQDLGEEGHERHDVGARHELRDLVDALVHRLELLLLRVHAAAGRDGPQDVDDAHVEPVADRHSLADVLREVHLQVVHLVHDCVLQKTGHGKREAREIVGERRAKYCAARGRRRRRAKRDCRVPKFLHGTQPF